MRTHFFLFAASLLLACQPEARKTILPEGPWIDLSYAYDSETIYWPTSALFQLDTVSEGMTEGGYYYSAYQFCTAEHGGTHLDAPVHFAKGRQSVDALPLERLIGEAIVVDVSDSALQNRDYLVSTEDLQAWEARHGEIPTDRIILLRTGYGQFWPDPEQYMGTAARGAEAIAQLHFPGLSPEAARWLSATRKAKAIGIDTPSIDYGQSSTFETHQILAAQNIPVFENVARLEQLPETGIWLIALPVKIGGGSGGPVRIAACILQDT